MRRIRKGENERRDRSDDPYTKYTELPFQVIDDEEPYRIY